MLAGAWVGTLFSATLLYGTAVLVPASQKAKLEAEKGSRDENKGDLPLLVRLQEERIVALSVSAKLAEALKQLQQTASNTVADVTDATHPGQAGQYQRGTTLAAMNQLSLDSASAKLALDHYHSSFAAGNSSAAAAAAGGGGGGAARRRGEQHLMAGATAAVHESAGGNVAPAAAHARYHKILRSPVPLGLELAAPGEGEGDQWAGSQSRQQARAAADAPAGGLVSADLDVKQGAVAAAAAAAQAGQAGQHRGTEAYHGSQRVPQQSRQQARAAAAAPAGEIDSALGSTRDANAAGAAAAVVGQLRGLAVVEPGDQPPSKRSKAATAQVNSNREQQQGDVATAQIARLLHHLSSNDEGDQEAAAQA